MQTKIIHLNHAQHAAAILDILNEAIVNSTALYDYVPRPLSSMDAWFATKAAGNAAVGAFPVLGLLNGAGELLGFASYGTFRNYPAFKYSMEHSVYIHKDHRDCGYAGVLMQALQAHAEAQGVHIFVGAIDAQNAASIALHEKLGFKHSGTIAQAGFKFGRWLDLVFYQKTLGTPEKPIDG